MPQIFKIGPYSVYFWSNEGNPLEPVHVHIAEGRPYQNATKTWLTSGGSAVICGNASKIPEKLLLRLIRIIEANSDEIIEAWKEHFGEIRFIR